MARRERRRSEWITRRGRQRCRADRTVDDRLLSRLRQSQCHLRRRERLLRLRPRGGSQPTVMLAGSCLVDAIFVDGVSSAINVEVLGIREANEIG